MRNVCLPILLAVCVAASVPAQADTQAAESNAVVDGQAYKGHRVAESIDAFAKVCLTPDLSVARAASVAKAAKVGLEAPTRYRAAGKPLVDIRAQRNGKAIEDRDEVFDWFICRVDFRGTWADVVLPSVKTELQAAGFKVSSGFARHTEASMHAYGDKPIVIYRGTATRGGHSYGITVAHSPGGSGKAGQTKLLYGSGTTIGIEMKK